MYNNFDFVTETHTLKNNREGAVTMRTSLEQFVGFFTHEFMEELWYLHKVSRGDIPQRQKKDLLESCLKVSQALLSFAPIPGVALGLLFSKEIIEQGKKVWETAQKAQELVSKAYSRGKEFLETVDTVEEKYHSFMSHDDQKGFVQESNQGLVDLEAMRLLAEFLARGLAQRYEHIITKKLDTRRLPQKSIFPLARVGSKRCFEYLQSQPFINPKNSPPLLTQRARLINSVSLGNLDKSWREQFTDKVSQFVPRCIREIGMGSLATQEELKIPGKFTSEGVYLRSAWYDEKAIYESKSKAHQTEWIEKKDDAKQTSIHYSKFGFAYLESADIKPFDDLDQVLGVSYEPSPAKEERFFQIVGAKEIKAYLNCDKVKEAKESKLVAKTASYTFHQFLHKECNLPEDCQAICREDLTTSIRDWSFGNFLRVDFSGARLSGKMDGCCFDESYLVGTTFIEIKIESSVTKPSLSFAGANLAFAQLEGAPLARANCTQTNLSFANLTGANITGIRHEGTIWYKTRLTGVIRDDDFALSETQATQIAQIQKQLQEHIDARLAQLEKEMKPMLACLDKLEEKLAKLKGTQDEESRMLVEQKQQLMSLIAQQDNLSQFKRYCEQELDQLRKTVKGQGDVITKMEEKIKLLTDEKNKVDKQLEEFQQQLAQLQGSGTIGTLAPDNTTQRLEEEMARLTREKSKVDKQLEELRKKVDELEKFIKTAEEKSKILTDKVKELRDEMFSMTTLKAWIEAAPDPINTVLNRLEQEEKRGNSSDKRQRYLNFIEAIKSANNSRKVFNSPQIFKFGVTICKKLEDGKEILIKEQKDAKYAQPEDKIFPGKILDIVLGIVDEKAFKLTSKKWLGYYLHIAWGTGFLKTTNDQNDTEGRAHITLTQVGDTDFFTMRVGNRCIRVSSLYAGTVYSEESKEPGSQGHFRLTPYQNGEYFTITSEEWPDSPLSIASLGGIVHSERGAPSVRAHIGLSVFGEAKPAATPSASSSASSSSVSSSTLSSS